ncbi:MAG: transcription elongation factor GreA [Actinobacteria bacterium]|nr:MAG: transcription elongation factor GreA [Actinomycetota bacterium]
MTPEGYEALKAELAELEGPARREIAERIKTAREWGDLKENSEYHDAKNDQAFLETRIKRLAERLRNAEVVKRGAGDGGAQVGSRVALRDEASGRTVTYELVGANDADLSAGRLSVASPLAQAALGRREGDVVVVRAPRGEMRYTVVALE